MGVVFGQIHFNDSTYGYDLLKKYCLLNNIEFTDYIDDNLLSTHNIPELKVFNVNGTEIVGSAKSISGMDSDFYEISIEGVPYPFYEQEFPQHVKHYNKTFEEKKQISKLSLWKRFMKFLDKSEIKLSKEDYFKKWEISELLADLHLASEMLSQREGGYSGKYLSVEEFKFALDEAIDDIEGGNKIDLSFFYYCFAPTCEWDDFTDENGIELGNRIFERVSNWKKWWDS